MSYSAFVFDFDYTLGDSTKGIVESSNYALLKMGLASHTMEEIKKTIGMSLHNTFTYLTGIEDKDKGDMFRKLFIEKADEIMTEYTVLFPDTIQVLSDIKNHGCKVGVLTTKIHRRIEDILNKYGISEFVDMIIGADDVIKLKPDPEGLFKAIHYFDLETKDVLYIGDTVIDANTASNADVDFFGVTTGTTTRGELSLYPKVGIADNLADLYNAVFKY